MNKAVSRNTSFLPVMLILVFCFTACNSDKGGNSAGRSNTSQSASDQVNLVFWEVAFGGESYLSKMEELCARFTKENPEIVIDYQSIPYDGYTQTFTTAIAGGSAPDIGAAGSSTQHLLAAMNEVLYLDSIVEEWKATEEIKDFNPGVLESMRHNGHQVGIPWAYDPMLLWYNIEHFEKAGITEFPQTMDELYMCLVKLKNAGYYGLASDLTFHSKALALWDMFAWNYGEGGIFKNGVIIIDNIASRKAFHFFRTMVKEGLMSAETAGYQDPEAVRQFLMGNVSIVFNNRNVQRIAESFPDALKYTGVMPALKTGNVVYSNQIFGLKQTKYPEKTKKFIAWLSANGAELFTQTDLFQLPVRISIQNLVRKMNLPYVDFIFDEIFPNGHSSAYPNVEVYTQLQTIQSDGILTTAIQQAILTDEPIDSITANARREIEKIMKQ